MSTIHAKFENGVFKPLDPVDLPEDRDVEFEPRMVVPVNVDPVALDRVYAVLSERYDSDDGVVVKHHDEHQP